MSETVEIKTLMRISKFAKMIDRSPAWVKKLAEKDEIDLVNIDGFYFVRINGKFRKYVK